MQRNHTIEAIIVEDLVELFVDTKMTVRVDVLFLKSRSTQKLQQAKLVPILPEF